MNKKDFDELIEKTYATIQVAIKDEQTILAKRFLGILEQQLKISKTLSQIQLPPSKEEKEKERIELMNELNRRLDRYAEAKMGKY